MWLLQVTGEWFRSEGWGEFLNSFNIVEKDVLFPFGKVQPTGPGVKLKYRATFKRADHTNYLFQYFNYGDNGILFMTGKGKKIERLRTEKGAHWVIPDK